MRSPAKPPSGSNAAISAAGARKIAANSMRGSPNRRPIALPSFVWKRGGSAAELLSALQTFKPQRLAEPQRRRWWAITGAAAAAAIALAAYGISGNYFQKPKTQTYATTIGGRETLALADGSEIELNTDTSLRISNEAGTRKAWLDRGEAYFKIKHDAAHPFVVIAGAHRITDLGTKFTVRDEDGGIKVALMEGRARLDAAGKTGPRSVTLTPGDVALATATSLSVNKKPAPAAHQRCGLGTWRAHLRSPRAGRCRARIEPLQHAQTHHRRCGLRAGSPWAARLQRTTWTPSPTSRTKSSACMSKTRATTS